jgi:hypothetical protein
MQPCRRPQTGSQLPAMRARSFPVAFLGRSGVVHESVGCIDNVYVVCYQHIDFGFRWASTRRPRFTVVSPSNHLTPKRTFSTMLTPEQYKLFAEVSKTDQAAAKWFGVAIGSLVTVFILAHWTQKALSNVLAQSRTSSKICSTVLRPLKRFVAGVSVPGGLILPGRITLALIYFAINGAVTFTNVNWSTQTFFAKRLGW